MGNDRYSNFSHSIQMLCISIRFNLLLLTIALTHSSIYAVVTSLRLEARRVSVQSGQACAEVVGGGAVLLRVRVPDEQKCYELAEKAVRAIEEALLQNATPTDVSLRKVPGGFAIDIKGIEAIVVDHAIACAARSLPEALAELWAKHLRRLLGKAWLLVPYDELVIPVDETTIVAVRGTATGQWRVTAEPADAVQLDFDPRQRMLRLRGCRVADGSLSIRCDDAMLKVPMRIRLRAARLKRMPVAFLSGAQVPADFVREAAENALLIALERQPGSYVRYELDGTSAMDAPSGGLVSARIHATGDDYLPLELETSVRIAYVDLPQELAAKLIFSNEPESVVGEHVLSYGMLPSADGPTRLVYHHANAGKHPIWLRLELFNATDGLVHIVTRFAYSGPTRDEIHAGHAAIAAFLKRWYNRACFLLTIPPRSVYIAAEHPLPSDGVVSGIWELILTSSVQGAVGYQLRTVTQPARGRIQPLNATLPPALNVRWKLFDEPMCHTKAIHEVGGKWAFIHIGRESLKAARGVHQLRGNYGVIYHATVEVRNNRNRSSWSELVFAPNGGIARAAVLVDGELFQAPPLAPPREVVLKRWRIPAHSVQQHEIYTMPAPGSNYPISLIIRSP